MKLVRIGELCRLPHPFAGLLAKGWETARALQLLLASVFFLVALPATPQSTPAAPQNQPNQSQQQPGEPHHGQVIFSRSTDENGQTTTTVGPGAQQPAPNGQSVEAPTASDAEREALTFTEFNMDVHLRSAEHEIAVRALITVRNDGKSPLTHIPLQISSSLHWERIRVAATDALYTIATLNSDTDHTGQLHEAAVKLATPLAPGATLQLDVTYSGAIPQSAQRLLAIGTPEDVALHSDWDAIDTDFTGLRGFGNVVWYPASAPPVILGDGARVFDEMGEHKLRMAGAHFFLRLTVEFPHGHAPTVAVINGHSVPLAVTEPQSGSDDISGVATATLDSATLGFEAPSLFVAVRAEHPATNTTLWTLPDADAAVAEWASAASTVTPFLQGWLGQAPRSQLTILDLPDPEDAPFETGPLLVTAIQSATPAQLTGVMAHALTHAWMSSPRAWLSEGVAHFMGTLWLEKQSGRQKALEVLESGRNALALIEPPSPGESAGQPLAQAISPVYYRTKATYVFWMLRDLVGDPALSAALRAYDPAQDAARGLGPNSGSGSFEKLLEQASLRRDLSWFFAEWVDADKGLPDLAIDHVFYTSAEPSSHIPNASDSSAPPEANGWIVTVDLANSGYAAAEVPITVRNPDTSVTQRVLVPARAKGTERILIQGRPTEVQANDGTVPETQASVHIRNLPNADSNSSSSQPGASPQ
ncbi:MAG: hypothetical protein P4K93_10310 [Terracidiphilus sp.]|nr:hypothetical protein [Terracidiphilus sp.]